MGCSFSFLSFPIILDQLRLHGIRIVAFHTDYCTAHLQYKHMHFQLAVRRDTMILRHRMRGRSGFPTIAALVSAMERVAENKDMCELMDPFDRYSVYADIWKDEMPNRCEVRINFAEVPLSHREALYQCTQNAFTEFGFPLSSITSKCQAIVVLPSHHIPGLKRAFLDLPSNPIYDWRNYT